MFNILLMNVVSMKRIMGNLSTLLAVVSGVAVIYVCHSLYSSHTLLKRHSVFDVRRAPGSVYFIIRYIHQSLCKKRGHVRENKGVNQELIYTFINCRYDQVSLRRFCCVVGYGWDYPDSVFRDIPLCYPEFLCRRLITMIVCSENFRLSPQGLLSVRETLVVSQAVDELKKGLFSLQARVMEYRAVSTGVEVDLSLTASRDEQMVWSNTLTLLSPNSTYKPDARPETEITHDVSSLRSVQVAVPWIAGVRCAWVFGDTCPLSAFLLGLIQPTVPSLWMFSRCMVELEKHKGVEVVQAPLMVSVRHMKPLSLPKQVTIRISENTDTEPTIAMFSMEDHQNRTLYVSGQIQRQI